MMLFMKLLRYLSITFVYRPIYICIEINNAMLLSNDLTLLLRDVGQNVCDNINISVGT